MPNRLSLFLRSLSCLALACAWSAPAYASLVYCNRSTVPLEAAVGYRGPADDGTEDWVSEGWWKIQPGQCAKVYGQPLGQRFYFYYAVALTMGPHDTQPYAWSGKYEFCVDTKAFKATGDGNCEGRGFQTKPFQQVDIKPGTRDYTLDFKSAE